MNTARSCGGWLAVSLPLLLALVFAPAFAAPFSVPKNAIFVSAACFMAASTIPFWHKRGLERGERELGVVALLYMAVVVTSALMSPLRYMSLQSVVFLVSGLLLFASARISLAGHQQKFLVATLMAGAAVALISVLQFMNVDPLRAVGVDTMTTGRMRMYGTLGNPNFVATFVAGTIPAALALSSGRSRLRTLWIAAALLIGVAVVLTGSRTGVLAMAAAVTVFGIITSRRRIRFVLCASIAFACLMAIAVRLNARSVSQSFRGRLFISQVALSNGAITSATGSGPGTFAYLYPVRLGQFFATPESEPLLHYAGNEAHAQNDYVEALHDTGWLGLVCLVALLSVWFHKARHKQAMENSAPSRTSAAAIAGVSAICVASLFDFPMHRAETWGLLCLWMALPFATNTVSKPDVCRLFAAAAVLGVGAYFAVAPALASYWTAQGEMQERHDRPENAVTAYRAALRWDSAAPDANFSLVRALAKTGQYRESVAQSDVATRYVNEPELFILRSRVLFNAGQHSDALHELDSGLRQFPYSLELRREMASYVTPNGVPVSSQLRN